MITAWLAAACTCAGRRIREQYGWQLSRITNILTNATPRVFNYRIIWADGSKGPAELSVENYGHGSDALNPCGVSVSVSGLFLLTYPLITPRAARGFCHAVVLCLCQV